MKYCLNGIFYKAKNKNLRKRIFTHDDDFIDNNKISFFTSQKSLVDHNEKNYGCFEEQSVFIISSALIYNKLELVNKIDEKNNESSNSEIILKLYRRYGHEIVDIIDGDYAFVLWDEKRDELFCCRSKTGRIPLYYYETNEYIIFSTLFKSFFRYFRIELLLNDQYIADYMTIKGVKPEVDSHLTIYKNIMQIPPGHYLSIYKNKIKLKQFWKPEKTNEIILKNDEEYEAALRDVLNKAIEKRVKNHERIGLFLSGGFDSGAVASLSCKNFIPKNQKLSTFTFIPIRDYQNWLTKRQNANEESFVREYEKYYDNIEMFFLPFEEKNSYLDINSYIKIFEQPYKSPGNVVWFFEIVKKAYEKNLSLLLTGEAGNGTISFGAFYPYLNTLIKQNMYKEFFKEINSYANLKNIRSTTIFVKFLINKLPVVLKKFLFKWLKKENLYFEYIPVNKDIIDLRTQEERFKVFDLNNKGFSFFEHNYLQQRLLNLNKFSYNGPHYSKLALKYDVLFADPTEDVDVIEFCLNLPENQFVRNGEERRLIKRAMKGYIPDKILNSNVRGKQSADWVQRIKPYWPVIKEEIMSIGDFQLEKRYLDRTIIQKNLDMLENFDFIRGDNLHMRILFRTLIFSRFLRMVEKGTLFDD